MKTLDAIQNSHSLTWLPIGIFGAGDARLSEALASNWRSQGCAISILDGYELRKGLSNHLDFSFPDREEQSPIAAEPASFVNANRVMSTVSSVSPSECGRAVACQIIGSGAFVDSCVSTSLHSSQQRGHKGFYAKAKLDASHQLTGVSAPYEALLSAESVIDISQAELTTASEQFISFFKA